MSKFDIQPDTLLSSLFIYQIEFQKALGHKDLPINDPQMMEHHLLGLVGEIGEVLQADQRWKDNG